MATYLGPGRKGQNCLGFVLGVPYGVELGFWTDSFVPCAADMATHVGWFSGSHPPDPTRDSIDALRYRLDHVARVVCGHDVYDGDLRRWEVEQKVATHGGRYRTTVGEVIDGFVSDPRDPGRRRHRTPHIEYGGHPLPLMRRELVGVAGAR